jgi:hypothetical protein
MQLGRVLGSWPTQDIPAEESSHRSGSRKEKIDVCLREILEHSQEESSAGIVPGSSEG